MVERRRKTCGTGSEVGNRTRTAASAHGAPLHQVTPEQFLKWTGDDCTVTCKDPLSHFPTTANLHVFCWDFM